MLSKLQDIFPKAPRDWLVPLTTIPQKYGIDTPEELASFLGQLYHESNGLTAFEESLNYTPQAIIATFNRRIQRFTLDEAQFFGRTADHPANQIMIANIAYANRLGNGDRFSGHGWLYRGRGPIQLTFRGNYEAFQKATGYPVLVEPFLLSQESQVGIECACWFWREHGLDKYDDDDDVRSETRIVNGGDHGLQARQFQRDRAFRVLTS
jgi:putative chitinase